MLSKKELFDKAADYDFDAIKEYLESGGDIEVYDGGGNSLLSALLEAYLTKYVSFSTAVLLSAAVKVTVNL